MKIKIFQLIFIYCYIISDLIYADEYLTEHPSYLKGCQIFQPEFTKCSTESVQGLFKQMAIGIPGMKGVDSFDPFYWNKIKISQGNNQAVNIKVELSKVKIHGFANMIVKESRVSPKDFSWKTSILIPKMRIEGDYVLQGRILLIPLNGRGKIYLDLADMDLILYTKTKLYSKGGLTFYNVTSVRADYSIKGLRANLTNLFNGNTDLEESTNSFFNDNWQMLNEALRPVISQTVEDILLDVLQKVFHYVPGEYFVTDIPTPEQLYGKKDK